MAKKDSGKKTVLPAIGKPKPKSKKTSARDLGKAANSQFKQGYADKDKKSIGPTSKGKYLTAKEEAKYIAEKIKRNKPVSPRPSYDRTRTKIARITGV